ncbi:MAG: hypothetical protein H0T54_05200 [Geodermatophilaceae bacterium]|nr:hypothetical protein [Geodermatophilaceae bacterium]
MRRSEISTTLVLVWVWILLGIAAVAVFAWYSAKQRREAMQQRAENLGFTYVPNDPYLLERFAALGDPFDRGFGRRATNILVGSSVGRPAIAWDYSYKIRGSQRNTGTTTHHLGIVCVEAGLVMPRISVLPDGVVSRDIGALLGSDVQYDVSQVRDQEFNRTFTVTSAQPSFANELLDAGMTEFLLFHPHEGFKIDGTQVMRISPGHLRPEDMQSALAYLDGVLDRIPYHVRRTLRPLDQG